MPEFQNLWNITMTLFEDLYPLFSQYYNIFSFPLHNQLQIFSLFNIYTLIVRIEEEV